METLSGRLSRLPPGRQIVTSDLVAEHQRERIRLATTELVGERGYRGTTIDRIAKTAHVALATFYENFSSKEECFLAAYEQAIEEGGTFLADAMDSDPERPWPERVGQTIGRLLELIAANPAHARMCLVEVQTAGGDALARHEQTLGRVAARLREGRKLNPDAQLPESHEEAVVGGFAWLLHQRLVAGEDQQLASLAPEMIEIALTPYVGETEAAGVAASQLGAKS